MLFIKCARHNAKYIISSNSHDSFEIGTIITVF